MSIRTRLIVSYLAVIVCLSGGFALFAHFYISNTLLPQNIATATECVHDLADANATLSEEIVNRAGEALVAAKCEAAAHELVVILQDLPRPLDYAALRTNKTVREVATEPIRFGLSNEHVIGNLVLADTNGTPVVHPVPAFEGSRFFEHSTNYAELVAILARAVQSGSAQGYYDFPDPETGRERRKFMVIRRVRGTPLMVAATVFHAEFFQPVQERIRAIEEREQAQAQAQITAFGMTSEIELGVHSLMVLAGLSVVALAFGLLFARSIARPIMRLRTAVQHVGAGDFAASVPVGGPPEIEQLALTFNTLGEELRRYTHKLAGEIAARRTFESEIRIAREIQQSLVPRTFPPFPHRPEFDLHAVLEPAREVAGDLYDFFFVDDHTLALIVGDVSGKSVPAAFFMAITRTVLRGVCTREHDPARVLAHANELLAEGNDACMFVTLFLGLYDIHTGTLTYANAGHHQAYVIDPAGTVHAFGVLGDPPLGIMPGHRYHCSAHAVGPGQALLVFTDGVTEAHSPEMEMYGSERLEAVLRSHTGDSPRELCTCIQRELSDFQHGTVFDDITLLVLQNRLRAA